MIQGEYKLEIFCDSKVINGSHTCYETYVCDTHESCISEAVLDGWIFNNDGTHTCKYCHKKMNEKPKLKPSEKLALLREQVRNLGKEPMA